MKIETLEKLDRLVKTRTRLEQVKHFNIRQRAEGHRRNAAHLVKQASRGPEAAGPPPSIQHVLNAEKFSRENLLRAQKEQRKADELTPATHAQRENLRQALRKELATSGLLRMAARARKKQLERREERKLEALHQLKSRSDKKRRPASPCRVRG